MNKMSKKLLTGALAGTMMLAMSAPVLAKGPVYQNAALVDVVVDTSQSAQIPVEGWFEKTLASGRTLKAYFPEIAYARSYVTVVAVPDGVKDLQKWAKQQGFTKLMDQKGEVIIYLEPQGQKWGDFDTELAYVKEAMSWVGQPKNDAGQALFAGYGCYYLAGYGNGCKALEGWSAANPEWVAGQVFVGGKSAGKKYLNQTGSIAYDGTLNTTGQYRIDCSGIEEWEENMAAHGKNEKALTKADIPVPTWFINYKANDYSIKYWMNANDCMKLPSGTILNQVYYQDLNSDAWATEFDNSYETKHGISQVKISASLDATAKKIYSFVSKYTRYNTTLTYSNVLGTRIDYTDITKEAEVKAEKAAYLSKDQFVAYDEPITDDLGNTYDGYYVISEASKKVAKGTIQNVIFAPSDYDGDGVMDAREYLMYIPDSVKGKKAPIMFQLPGGGQSVEVGFDCTQWWRLAEENEFIIVILAESYNNHTAALTWTTSDMVFVAANDIIKNNVDGVMADVDWTRVYASGHSQGSLQSHNFAHFHPDFVAAIATTSGKPSAAEEDGVFQTIPAAMISGEQDMPDMLPNLFEGQDAFKGFFRYLAKSNDLKVEEATADNADAAVTGAIRTYTWTWNNKQEIPMVMWGQTYLREHNAVPSDHVLLWDFASHYSKDADGNRFYSPSAFEKIDAILIGGEESYITDFDQITSLSVDWSQAAQLPVTGFYNKNIAVGEETRTVKTYISDTASVRSYFTVVAVPDGVDTYEFLEKEGWIDIADKKGEGLYVLEPGKDGWGSAEEEAAYVTAAMNWLKAPNNANKIAVFSTFGEFYLAGYGKGAAPLQTWAVSNPIFVIAQTYVNGDSLSKAMLKELSSVPYGKDQFSGADLEASIEKAGFGAVGTITRADVPVPTWFAGKNYKAKSADVAYWIAANDASMGKVADTWHQSIKSDAYQTLYANAQIKKAAPKAKFGISEVKMNKCQPSAADIYGYMSQWSRYDNSFAYSNAIAPRLDYTAAKVAAQKDAEDQEIKAITGDGVEILAQEDAVIPGHGTVQVGIFNGSDLNGDGQKDPREYILYVPAGHKGEKLPVMYVYPGGSQTDIIFFDSTSWWQIAEEKGLAVLYVCENYTTNPVSVTHTDSNVYQESVFSILKDTIDGVYADLDFTRQYGTGQSQGSLTVQGFATTNPEYFAAVASTSGIGGDGTGVDQMIPVSMITGESDMADMLPNVFEGQAKFQNWAKYLIKVNQVEGSLEGGYTTVLEQGRTNVNKWANKDGIVLFQWGQTMLRHHNCYPSDMWACWDFAKNFSKDENGIRSYSASAFKKNDAVVIGQDKLLTTDDVVSVQATTKPNFYGQRLNQIAITFAEGTNMARASKLASYGIWDRDFDKGFFEEGSSDVVDVAVDGNTVTLSFGEGPANNDAFGMLCTANWNYARKDSAIYNTVVTNAMKSAGDAFAAMAYGGYQTRDNLDLVLFVGEKGQLGEDGLPEGGIALTDGFGNKLEDTVWEDTVNIDYDDFTLEYWDIANTPEKYSQFDGKVPVYYYVPDSYKADSPMTLVLYITGSGTSYYEKKDADGILLAANKGTDMSYDNCCAAWKNLSEDDDSDNDVIVGTVDVYSSDNPAAGGELDKAILKFMEMYNIKNVILEGNSNGTSVCSEALRQRPDIVDAFLINNGCIGTKRNTSVKNNTETMAEFEWSDEEVAAIIDNGIAFWILNGERDNLADPTYALKSLEYLKTEYAKAGYSEEWIAENCRESFYKNEQFTKWGVSNHSCVKVTSTYYLNNPYLNVFGDEMLQPGDTYMMENPLDNFHLDLTQFTFTVYGDSIAQWVQNRGVK